MSPRFPSTPAITALRGAGAEYREHLYDYRRSALRSLLRSWESGPTSW